MIRYAYHSTAAVALYTLARFGSWLMRYAGIWSNHHEREAEKHKTL